MVLGIREGLVAQWNLNNPSLAVKVGDSIIDVNGAGGGTEMSNALATESTFKIVIKRRLWRGPPAQPLLPPVNCGLPCGQSRIVEASPPRLVPPAGLEAPSGVTRSSALWPPQPRIEEDAVAKLRGTLLPPYERTPSPLSSPLSESCCRAGPSPLAAVDLSDLLAMGDV